MDAYDRIKLARKVGRATAKNYIDEIFTGFMEMHGDRYYCDDHAIIGGIAYLDGIPVTVIGIEKGYDFSEKAFRHFGCVLPEGYRKALRLMKQAEKFKRPVICFVDTQGAGCGRGAEERGIGEAIAENLAQMMTLKVPIITIMIGEGGSGGALALSVADEVWMLSNAHYSVVSPESCASILYKDPDRKAEAASNLKLFAEDLFAHEIVERIIGEPKDFENEKELSSFMKKLEKDLLKKVHELLLIDTDTLLKNRYEKFRKIGRFEEIVS